MSDQSIVKVTAEVGCLNYSKVREAVSYLKWKGHRIDCIEGSGWLSRTFYFTGSLFSITFLKFGFRIPG